MDGAPSRPSALERTAEIGARLAGRRLAAFLDYDGTLTPIVARPELAALPAETRGALRRLSTLATVAVVSGRALDDVRALVGLEDLHYAGNHGLEIRGPGGSSLSYEVGDEFVPALREAARRLGASASRVAGAWVEDKGRSLSVHYRQVAEQDVGGLERAVDAVVLADPLLRKHHGKKVFEVRPRVEWDKGRAVVWLLEALGLGGPETLPLYVGDDVTDEDAFRALAGPGVGVRVGDSALPTWADYTLRDPSEVRRFLEVLAERLERG
jgi:alpha,alpha-trehalase